MGRGYRWAISIMLLAAACAGQQGGGAPAPASPATTTSNQLAVGAARPAQNVWVNIGAYVRMVLPDYFAPMTGMLGYTDRTTGSRVLVVEAAVPFTQGFVLGAIKGMADSYHMQKEWPETVDGQRGMRFEATMRTGGGTFRVFGFLTGDEQKSLLIQISAPEADGPLLSTLEQSLEQMKLDLSVDAPMAELPYELGEVEGLRRLRISGTVITYAEAGGGPARLTVVVTDDTDTISQMCAGANVPGARADNLEQAVVRPLTVSDMKGCEVEGLRITATSGSVEAVYRAYLVDGRNLLTIEGTVEPSRRDIFFPKFRALTRTLHRRP